MGKKSFVDGYDPFGTQIRRDEERLAARESGPATPPPQGATAHAVDRDFPVELPRQVAEARRTLTVEEDDEESALAPPARAAHPQSRTTTAKVVPLPPSRARETSVAERGSAPRSASPDSGEQSPRLKISHAAFQDLETTLANIFRLTGSQIHYSIATRALWELLVGAEAQVQEELRKHPLGRLPTTRNKLGYAEYQDRIKRVFGLAFRKLPRSLFESPAVNEETSEG